jgi:lysosomal Pro-X carboxypeptidase
MPYTNILFTNGLLDPWSAGGVPPITRNPDLQVIVIANSAHHLELRSPNAADPIEVVNARATIIQTLKAWALQYNTAVQDNTPAQ